jgi:2-methylcitrate dehydratase PrpD
LSETPGGKIKRRELRERERYGSRKRSPITCRRTGCAKDAVAAEVRIVDDPGNNAASGEGRSRVIARDTARFIAGARLNDMPEMVFGQAKMAMLDWFAALLLAFAEDRDSIEPLLRTAKRLGGRRTASVVGERFMTSPAWAALVNGYAGHLLDYDETTPPVRSHLTACVFPAVLAMGEEKGATGADLLEAYIIGYEVAIRIGEAMTPGWMQEGWHGTPIFGIFGAAAGCGRLEGLSPDEAAHALGIASSMASGIATNFGTMTKPLHAGQAAKNAVLAALLAKEGVTASVEAIEGFFQAHSWSSPAKAEALQKLGNPWAMETKGTINPKLYPCCHGLATTIEYGIIFKEKYGLTPGEIEEIEIYSAPKALSAMHSRRYADTGEDIDWRYEGPPRQLAPGIPATGKEAKFSKEYGFAASFLHGAPESRDFTDDAVRKADVQGLMKKIKVFHDCELDKISYRYPEGDWPYGERFVLRLKDGRTIREEQIFVLGAARRPLSMEHVRKKFRTCASAAGFPDWHMELLIDSVAEIERAGSISELLKRFRPEHRAGRNRSSSCALSGKER